MRVTFHPIFFGSEIFCMEKKWTKTQSEAVIPLPHQGSAKKGWDFFLKKKHGWKNLLWGEVFLGEKDVCWHFGGGEFCGKIIVGQNFGSRISQ